MRLFIGAFFVTVCWSIQVQSSPLAENLEILHRTRRREPTRREIDVVVEWLKRNLPTMGLELCNPEDAYEGLRCPGTDEVDDLCVRWDEICDGEQKCGLRKRELCINTLMEEEGLVREVAEDKCNGDESKDMCDVKEKEPPRCGRDYELNKNFSSVEITSPQYPNSYPGDLNCFWRVKGPPGSKLAIHFLEFDSEANYDYLNLGVGHKCDPVDRMKFAIYKHSGSSLPNPSSLIVNNNEIFTSFHSDYHDDGQGFRLEVSIAETGSSGITVAPPVYNTTCGGKIQIEANEGAVISSPNYPNKYYNLYQCDWLIQLPKGRRMGLRFRDLVTEKGADILKIGGGRKVNENLLYTLSGNVPPDDIIVINYHKGWLRFTTDDSNRRKGFRVQIFDYPLNDCGGSFEVPRDGSVAVASPLYPFRAYRLNQECLWQFNISNGRKLSVSITEFSLSFDDILSVGSGERPAYDWSNYIIKEARGETMPRPKKFFSSKNSVWFYFRSNDANVNRGFKAEVFDSKLYKPKKKPKKGKRKQPYTDCLHTISREDVYRKITIQSPGFPGPYGPLMECYWIIDIPFGGDIRMRFEYLNTEKHLDTLTIGNGTNPNKKKTAVLMYSGFETPETFEGVFHQMWIRFNSDIKNQFGGFSLTIEPRPYIQCGGELQVPSDGSLALGSPNYPGIYPNNAICRYVVRGPLHHRISVSIAGFETEADEDTLTVSEGCPVTDPDGNNLVLYKYSGRALPVNYQSLPRSDTIWIEFKSNERNAYHGFLLNFADTPLKAVPAEGVGCPAYNRTNPADFITNTGAD